MEKGVADLLRALQKLKDNRSFFGFIVGGPADDQKAYQTFAQDLGLGPADVLFTGEIPAHEVPSALTACDILCMPFPDLPHYRTNMSPLKMFEYMAAKRPVVASDLPTLRDVLSEETAFFFVPGNVGALADALRFVAVHPDDAAQRAERAHLLVASHTWVERMRRILSAATLGT